MCVKVNVWFTVPDMPIYIVFGIGVALSMVSTISLIAAKRKINSMPKRVNGFIRR